MRKFKVRTCGKFNHVEEGHHPTNTMLLPLTFAARHRTRLLSCRKSQLARPTPPRMNRANLQTLRDLSIRCSPFRTALSSNASKSTEGRCRETLTAVVRNLRSLDFSALQPQRIRTPFLPPCQSPPHR